MKPNQSSVYSLMLAPLAAASAARSAAIDISNAEYATIVVTASAEVNTSGTNVTLAIAHGDDGTNYTTLSTTLLDNTAAAKQEFHIDTKDKKKFLRVTVTPGTNATNDLVITTVHAITVSDIKTASTGIVL